MSEWVRNDNPFFRRVPSVQPQPAHVEGGTAHQSPRAPSQPQHHGNNAHPLVAHHVTHESDPQTGQTFAHRTGPHAHLMSHPAPEQEPHVRPETRSESLRPRSVKKETVNESLVPSDPRRDLGFLQRMRDFFFPTKE